MNDFLSGFAESQQLSTLLDDFREPTQDPAPPPAPRETNQKTDSQSVGQFWSAINWTNKDIVKAPSSPPTSTKPVASQSVAWLWQEVNWNNKALSKPAPVQQLLVENAFADFDW